VIGSTCATIAVLLIKVGQEIDDQFIIRQGRAEGSKIISVAAHLGVVVGDEEVIFLYGSKRDACVHGTSPRLREV
jgi:hypothetical protein